MISPDHEPHKTLENEVADFFVGRGFLVDDTTYHSSMKPATIRRLARLHEPTSLYIRGKADRIAVHETAPVCFIWETKTHGGSQYHNMALEAMPFVHHLLATTAGIQCMYIYRDETKGYDGCFWTSDPIPVRKIMIPSVWTKDMTQWYDRVFKNTFPGVPICTGVRSSGSGDPFIIIAEADLPSLLRDLNETIEYELRDHRHGSTL